jgi:hypothetical protein
MIKLADVVVFVTIGAVMSFVLIEVLRLVVMFVLVVVSYLAAYGCNDKGLPNDHDA